MARPMTNAEHVAGHTALLHFADPAPHSDTEWDSVLGRSVPKQLLSHDQLWDYLLGPADSEFNKENAIQYQRMGNSVFSPPTSETHVRDERMTGAQVRRAMLHQHRVAAQKRYAYTQEFLKGLLQRGITGETDLSRHFQNIGTGIFHASVPHNLPKIDNIERAQVLDSLFQRGANPSVLVRWPKTDMYSKIYPASGEISVLHLSDPGEAFYPMNKGGVHRHNKIADVLHRMPPGPLTGRLDINLSEFRVPISHVLSIGADRTSRKTDLLDADKVYNPRQQGPTWQGGAIIANDPKIGTEQHVYDHRAGHYMPGHYPDDGSLVAGAPGSPEHARVHAASPSSEQVSHLVRQLRGLTKSQKWWAK